VDGLLEAFIKSHYVYDSWMIAYWWIIKHACD